MSETGEVFIGTGRRKSAVARVRLQRGAGNIVVNNRAIDVHFPRATSRMVLMQPLVLTGLESQFDLQVIVRGGGQTGQADAVKHGIARALLKFNNELRGALKKAGYLTRDARSKERKKYGQKGARKRFQYSKR